MQWDLEAPPKFGDKAEILKTEVGSESGIETAVQDHRCPVLKFAATAGAGSDGFIAFAKIQPAAFGQHQRFTHCRQIHQTQKIGDHLDQGGIAKFTHVDELAAEAFQQRFMAFK